MTTASRTSGACVGPCRIFLAVMAIGLGTVFLVQSMRSGMEPQRELGWNSGLSTVDNMLVSPLWKK